MIGHSSLGQRFDCGPPVPILMRHWTARRQRSSKTSRMPRIPAHAPWACGTIRIGGAQATKQSSRRRGPSGYSGDRIEPAVELAEKGEIQYLVFECLGERTVALAQQARMRNPEIGYDPLLEERMRAVLPTCASKGIKIVTNMGAAHPLAAAARLPRLRNPSDYRRSKSPP
jgi:hypothetical protein